MTRSLRKNIFREIKSTLGRFVAIFAISALGAGFFAGLKATGPDMKVTAERYYEQQHLMDIRLLSTMGFSQDDVQALRAREDVDSVMAGWGMDLLVENPEGDEAARLLALPEDTGEDNPDYLNRPVLQQGRLPAAADECLADSVSGYRIGDRLRLSPHNDADALERMAQREFEVVGIATSPYYVSFLRGNTSIGNGKLSFFVYLTPDAFDREYYTEIFITSSTAGGHVGYSDAYQSTINAQVKALEAFGEERARIRYDEVVGEANAELADARAELADAKAEADEKLGEAAREIADGEQKIADGWAELRENEQKLADAQKKIEDGQAQLDDARLQLQYAQTDFDAARAGFEEKKQQATAALAQLDAFLAGVDRLDGLAAQLDGLLGGWPGTAGSMDAVLAGAVAALEGMAAQLEANNMDAASLRQAALALQQPKADKQGYEDAYGLLAQTAGGLRTGLEAQKAGINEGLREGQAQLDAAGAELSNHWYALHLATVELEDYKAELADGRRQIADARAELAEYEQELADGKAEYEQKKAEADGEIADAQQKIDDAQRELDGLDAPEWYVRTRADNPGYSGFWSDSDRIDAIAATIPVFFLLVAVLVCLTTMTRMVEEQRTLIGTLKAMGYSNAAIAGKYLLYASAASASGAALGVAVGLVIFPRAIWQAYGILYLMPALTSGNNLGLILLSVAVCVLCTTVATLLACAKELRSTPAQLMRPRAPRAGKRVIIERIGPLWRRLGFMHKVTARNLFRYKKRFFMTVTGVAGCTALLLTGFGLRDSIAGIVPLQFGGINTYNAVVVLAQPSSAGANTELNRRMPGFGTAVYIQETLVDARSDAGNNVGMTTYLFVAEDPDALPDYIRLAGRKSGQPLEYPAADGGVVVTEKLATRLKLAVGDSFEVNRVNEGPVTLTVSGIAENYVYNYVYMSPQQYTRAFGQAPEYTQLLLRQPDTGALGEDALVEALLGIDNVAGASHVNAFTGQFTDMFASLNAVIWLIIAAAGLLAFVVLYNLTNINITERGREIATLKVLGFYDGEVASYVYRENLVLTLIGILAGFALGYFLHDFVITTAEVDEVMFRRVIEPLSYLWSVLFTLACGALVDFVMMRRLRDIDMVESLKSAE